MKKKTRATASGAAKRPKSGASGRKAAPRRNSAPEPGRPAVSSDAKATIRRLKAQGLSIVLVEQNAKLVFDVADDIVVLNSGRVVVEGSAAQLTQGGLDLRQHLGIY